MNNASEFTELIVVTETQQLFQSLCFGASGPSKQKISSSELEIPDYRYRKPIHVNNCLGSTVAVRFWSAGSIALSLSASLCSPGADEVSSGFCSRGSRKTHQLQQAGQSCFLQACSALPKSSYFVCLVDL